MKVYNKALDFTVLAMASMANGEPAKAAKLMLQAAKAPDFKRAIAVLEASNSQAFKHEQAVKAEAIKAAAKPAAKPGKVAAAKRVAAAAKPEVKIQVKAFDMGDEAEIDDLIDSGDIDENVDDAEVEATVEEDEDEEDFDATFASVLKGM